MINGGPTVIMGVKQPSITSKWTSFTSVCSRRESSEPRLIMSAALIPTLMVGIIARRLSKPRASAIRYHWALFVFQVLEQLVGLLRLHPLMHNLANRLNHGR